jgi:hypothetical protein
MDSRDTLPGAASLKPKGTPPLMAFHRGGDRTLACTTRRIGLSHLVTLTVSVSIAGCAKKPPGAAPLRLALRSLPRPTGTDLLDAGRLGLPSIPISFETAIGAQIWPSGRSRSLRSGGRALYTPPESCSGATASLVRTRTRDDRTAPGFAASASTLCGVGTWSGDQKQFGCCLVLLFGDCQRRCRNNRRTFREVTRDEKTLCCCSRPGA